MNPFSGPGLRLAALAASVQFINGAHLPYFPLFLANRGFDAPTVGVLLAIPVFVRIVATPMISALGDRRVPPATLLVATHFGLGLTYLAMLAVDGFWSFAALGAVAGALHAGAVPLQDIVLMREIAQHPRLRYGRIRVWGTVSFMAASFIGGAVVARHTPEAIVALIALAAFTVAPVALVQSRRFDAPVAGRPETSAGRLLTPTTVLLIAGIALSHASHAGLNGFGSLNWERQGYGLDVIAWFWAMGFTAEIIVFWLSGALVTRFDRALTMLAIGAGVGLLRWIFMSLEPGLALSLFLQTWHAISFGFVHLAGVAAISIVAPPGRRATLMGVAGGAGAAVSGVAMLLSGRLYATSPSLMFGAMAGVAGAALACYALIWLSRRG